MKVDRDDSKGECEIGSEGELGLPLHQECMKQPPAVIVSSLVSVYPLAASTKFDNNLALHYALRHATSPTVIETLIITYPRGLDEKDAEGKLPIEVFKVVVVVLLRLWRGMRPRTSLVPRVMHTKQREGGAEMVDGGGDSYETT